jgi:hypothetical protein
MVANKRPGSGRESARSRSLLTMLGAGLPAWACIFFFLGTLMLTGCASVDSRALITPQAAHQAAADLAENETDRATQMVSDVLYFGLSVPGGGEVPARQWRQFLREVVTPRFSEGLTVWDAKGQFRRSNGVIVKESTKVLQLIHPDDLEHEAAVTEIIETYKQMFKQESVMRVRSSVSVSF